MSLLERLLGKKLPLALLFVEAGLFVAVIPIATSGVLGKMGYGTFVSMSVSGILFVISLGFYMKIFRARM